MQGGTSYTSLNQHRYKQMHIHTYETRQRNQHIQTKHALSISQNIGPTLFKHFATPNKLVGKNLNL